MQLLKLSLVAINLGGTVYTVHAWRDMDARVRALAIAILVMTFVAAIPGFIEGVQYITTHLGHLRTKPVALTPVNYALAYFCVVLAVAGAYFLPGLARLAYIQGNPLFILIVPLCLLGALRIAFHGLDMLGFDLRPSWLSWLMR
jgi:hypothetical protein